MKIAAVIATRGDVATSEIAAKLRSYPEIGEVRFVVGNTPFNRYAVMAEMTEWPWLYTQDDDCITDIEPLLRACDIAAPSSLVINAMTLQHAAQCIRGDRRSSASARCSTDTRWPVLMSITGSGTRCSIASPTGSLRP